MIQQLSVKDYILFDRADLEFGRDMAVITGETGAGKSLLIDAIGYLCGGRITSNIVRKGKDKAVLTMVISDVSADVQEFLEENGFEPEEELVITRTVSAAGKSSVRINQQITTLSFIKKLTARLIDIHSQMDTISLMDSNVQLDLLDQYAQADAEREAVLAAWHALSKARKELDHARNESFSDDELDFATERLNEIDQAQAKEGELEELQEKIKTASRFARSEEEMSSARWLLKKEGGILEGVFELSRTLKRNPEFAGRSEEISNMYYLLEALEEELGVRLEELRMQAQDLESMQEREYALKKLYRKYGGSFSSVMEQRAKLEDKIDRILHRQDVFERLEKQEGLAKAEYNAAAGALHAKRMAVLPELESAISRHARDLMLENCRFKIECSEKAAGSTGSDEVRFLASMNPGQPLTTLKQSASGGELSRLMLALKTVFQTSKGIDTIIFDEIDTGVSGKVALSMGSKMHALSDVRQVLCITHLASVAVWADEHWRISKSTDGTTTQTEAALLDGQGSLEELAVMAHGNASDMAVESMKELKERVRNGQGALSH